MHTKTSFAAAAVLSLAGLLAAGTSGATPIVFSTATDATTSGGPVSATATFTLDPSLNTLDIELADTLANPNNVGQLLSGLSFSLSGITSGSLTSSSGQDVYVGIGGVPTYGASGTSTGWVLQSGFDLCDICSSGKGASAPAGLIIGPPGSKGYTAAGGSIANNSGHNPFINETASFSLSVPGLSASDTISSVLFRFGTTYGTQTTMGGCTSGCGATSTVPEPGTLALFGAGLLGFAVFARRRRQRALRQS